MIDNQLLYSRLADHILRYVKDNQIQEGERIPSERMFSELFQSSRTSIREAIRILENKGIVEIRRGKGMYLKEQLNQEMYQIELWKVDYMEILDVRTVLDDQIIKMLCEYFPAENVSGIEQALEKLEQGYEAGFFDLDADSIFHKRLRAGCKNKTLVQLADNMMIKLEDYGPRVDFNKKFFFDTIPFHRQLLESIKRHDYESAREAYMKIYELDKNIFKTIQ